MNLKDAFRAQNKLQSLMDEASDILQDRGNTLKVTTTHLRSKVMPEARDAVVEESALSEYAEHINQVAAFLMAMLAEREKLSAAICDAKSRLPLDMDSETGLNRARQSLADIFRRMAVLRNREVVIANGGSGRPRNASPCPLFPMDKRMSDRLRPAAHGTNIGKVGRHQDVVHGHIQQGT